MVCQFEKKKKVNKIGIKTLCLIEVFKKSVGIKDILFSKLHHFLIIKSICKIPTSSILL